MGAYGPLVITKHKQITAPDTRRHRNKDSARQANISSPYLQNIAANVATFIEFSDLDQTSRITY